MGETMKRIPFITLTITILISSAMILWDIMPAAHAFEDKADQLSRESSYTFNPGYINAAKYKAESIREQGAAKKGVWENMVEYVKNKISNKVAEGFQDKVKPDLKQKTSVVGDTVNNTVSTEEPNETTGSSESVTLSKIAETSDTLLNIAKEKGVVKTVLKTGNTVNVWMEGNNAYFNITNPMGSVLVGRQQFSVQDSGALQKSYVSDIADLGTGKFAVLLTNYDSSVKDDIYSFDLKQSVRVYNSAGQLENVSTYNSYERRNLGTNEESYDYNIISKLFSPDVNKDGSINILDYGVIKLAWGMNTSSLSDSLKGADINKDGIVDNADYTLFQANMFKTSVAALGTNVKKDSYTPGTSVFTFTTSEGKTLGAVFNITTPTLTLPIESKRLFMLNTNNTNFDVTYSGFKEIKAEKLKAEDATPGILSKIEDYKNSVHEGDILVKNRPTENDFIDAETALMRIAQNPTEENKKIMETTDELLVCLEVLEKTSTNPEALKKAEDELIQAVTNIILAQAMPDLLAEGDMANIKILFSDLKRVKNKAVREYEDAVKKYYDKIIEDVLSKNMDALQHNGILYSNMGKEDLKRIKPSEIDKIIEKLKRIKNKTFAEEYILQQEAKYRMAYIDPHKKLLEENMKTILNDFTKKVSSTLHDWDSGLPDKK